MGYTPTKSEQEVTLTFDAEDGNAKLYTANPAWIRKMDKLTAANPEEFQMVKEWKVDGETVSKTYRFPKDLISIRSGHRKLSEEQRAALAEHAKRGRELRRISNLS